MQVERLEKEHVADSRRMRQMEEAALKAQSRLKASERSVTEQTSRYEARRPACACAPVAAECTRSPGVCER